MNNSLFRRLTALRRLREAMIWTPPKIDAMPVRKTAGDRAYSFDANLLLSDNAAAYTAAGFSQVGGADGVLNLGGNQAVTPVQQARMDAVCVVDVTALDAVTTDEAYRLIVVGSLVAAFTAGTVQVLGEMELAAGVLSVLGPGIAGVTKTATIGRYEILFSTEQNNVKYQFIKLYVVPTGTSPSISFQAFVAVLPEP